MATNDPAASSIVSGKLDLLYATDYRQSLLVGTELDERIQLYEVEVLVFDFLGSAMSTYTEIAAGFVDSADDPRAGYGLVDVTLLDSSSTMMIASTFPQTLVAQVVVYGLTLDGDEVVSEPWNFPIEVCKTTSSNKLGCLGCEAHLAEEQVMQPCRLGQDLPPDCRLMDEALSP